MLSSTILRRIKSNISQVRKNQKIVKSCTVLSGVKFNRLFSQKRFVKLTNKTENHNGLQYKNGLIIDPIPFDPTGVCKPGGIYFVEESEAHNWLRYDEWLRYGEMTYYMRKVSVPDTAKVYVEEGKFKTDKPRLGPKSNISNEIYLRFIENKLKKRDVCGNSNINIYKVLRYISPNCMNKYLCVEIIKRYGDAPYLLKYMSYDVIDKELCMLAIKRDGYALKYVPEHIKDKEICLMAIKHANTYWNCGGYLLSPIIERIKNVFSLIPDSIKDREIYIETVKMCGYMLKDVPKSMIDDEMCLIAVKHDGMLLEHILSLFNYSDRFDIEETDIPDIIRNSDICLEAVKQNGLALYHVPYILRDRKICEAAVRQNGLAYQYVPIKQTNMRLCMIAINQNKDAIKYMSVDLDRQLKQLLESQINQSIESMYQRQEKQFLESEIKKQLDRLIEFQFQNMYVDMKLDQKEKQLSEVRNEMKKYE